MCNVDHEDVIQPLMKAWVQQIYDGVPFLPLIDTFEAHPHLRVYMAKVYLFQAVELDKSIQTSPPSSAFDIVDELPIVHYKRITSGRSRLERDRRTRVGVVIPEHDGCRNACQATLSSLNQSYKDCLYLDPVKALDELSHLLSSVAFVDARFVGGDAGRMMEGCFQKAKLAIEQLIINAEVARFQYFFYN